MKIVFLNVFVFLGWFLWFPSLFYFLFCFPKEPEDKRRLITVLIFRSVFVVIFLQSIGCVCG